MRFKNPANNYEEAVTVPFLWTILFGFIYFAAKGVWTHAAVSLILVLAASSFTFGIGGLIVWLIYPFFARSIVRAHYLRRGWVESGA